MYSEPAASVLWKGSHDYLQPNYSAEMSGNVAKRLKDPLSPSKQHSHCGGAHLEPPYPLSAFTPMVLLRHFELAFDRTSASSLSDAWAGKEVPLCRCPGHVLYGSASGHCKSRHTMLQIEQSWWTLVGVVGSTSPSVGAMAERVMNRVGIMMTRYPNQWFTTDGNIARIACKG